MLERGERRVHILPKASMRPVNMVAPVNVVSMVFERSKACALSHASSLIQDCE